MASLFIYISPVYLHDYIQVHHSQWKHKTQHNTIVGSVMDAPDINLFPILQNRLEEEDGPAAFDDLEAHAGDRGEPIQHESIKPLAPNQSYSNMKRAKKRMRIFQESGRQPQINLKKLQACVQLCQDPAIIEGFNAETLPAALGGYSSLRLAKTRKKTPEIDRLMEQGYGYVAAQDLGDRIELVSFIFR